MDSASIDDDAVSRNATNFVTAIPMLAASAARIALVPPAVLTRPTPVDVPHCPLWSSAGELLHLVDRWHGGRIQSVREGQIDRREVGHGDQRREPLQWRAALGPDLGAAHTTTGGQLDDRIGPPFLQYGRLPRTWLVVGQATVAEYEHPQPGRGAVLLRIGEDVPIGLGE